MAAKAGEEFGKGAPRCTYVRKDGSRCKNAAMTGVNVCSAPGHGGRLPSVVEKSRRARLEKALARTGYGSGENSVAENHVGANPVTGYMWELRRTAGNIVTCEEFIRNLDPKEIIWGKTKEEVKDAALSYSMEGTPVDNSYTMTVEEAKVHMWVAIYMKEREHYGKLLKVGISAGLEERRLRLQEVMVIQLNGAITNIISRLGQDPADPSVRQMVREELIAIEGAPEVVSTEADVLAELAEEVPDGDWAPRKPRKKVQGRYVPRRGGKVVTDED